MAELKNNSKLVVGYDLGNLTSQISYYYLEKDEPETITTVAGMEQYNIPTVICKRNGVNQWYYGKEAEKVAAEQNGRLLRNLLKRVERGEEITLEDITYSAEELLALFVKRSFTALSLICPSNKVECIIITVEELSSQLIAVLKKAVEGLGVRTKEVFFQSREESFFSYILHQDEKIWGHQVVVCDVTEGYLKFLRLEWNKKTIPIVGFIDKTELLELDLSNMPEHEIAQENFKKMFDQQMLLAIKSFMKDYLVSTVYLIGDGFGGEWCKESLRYLCQGRRVFQGNNLYSKGACYYAKEMIAPSEVWKNYLFLGKDKVKSNVGMKLLRNGQESYYALLDAGKNWYESKKEVDLILESGNRIEIIVTALNGRGIQKADVILDGLPERPDKACRVKLLLDLLSESRLRIRVSDMGFGEMYPSSEQEWVEELELD